MPLPLSDAVPLRSTAVWPKFAKPEPLNVVYGRCTVPVIQADQSRKFWLVADHPIGGVDAVYIDGKPAQPFTFHTTTDATGHPVALLELAAPLPANAVLTVAARGKIHPDTGALIENPADVLLDILKMAGYALEEADLADFRTDCAGLRIAGMLSSGLTIRAQIAEIAESVGMLWSLAMPGIARRWPPDEGGAIAGPLHARFEDYQIGDVRADCRHDTLYTALKIEYDWDWSKNSARRSATLQADSAVLYGRRETTLAAKWLTDAASAVERATAWLEAYARPRWTLSMTADLEPRVPPGGWFAIWHPLLPAVGKMRSLDAEWDFKAQVQRLTAECSVGPLPAVTVTGVGGLFEQPSSGLRVTYADGVATLVIADPNDAPIRDAVVTLGSQKGKTDRTGTVRFKIARGTYPVTVEANGFSPVSMEITL